MSNNNDTLDAAAERANEAFNHLLETGAFAAIDDLPAGAPPGHGPPAPPLHVGVVPAGTNPAWLAEAQRTLTNWNRIRLTVPPAPKDYAMPPVAAAAPPNNNAVPPIAVPPPQAGKTAQTKAGKTAQTKAAGTTTGTTTSTAEERAAQAAMYPMPPTASYEDPGSAAARANVAFNNLLQDGCFAGLEDLSMDVRLTDARLALGAWNQSLYPPTQAGNHAQTTGTGTTMTTSTAEERARAAAQAASVLGARPSSSPGPDPKKSKKN